MEIDTLRHTLIQIETYCSQHNLLIFQGDISAGQESFWENKSPEDWQKFLSFMTATGGGILYLSELVFEPEEVAGDTLFPKQGGLDDDSGNAYATAAHSKETHRGEVAAFYLSFLHNGVCYRYEQEASWYAEQGEENDPEPDAPRMATPDILESARLEVEEEEAEKLAQAITADPEYLKLKTTSEQHHFICKAVLRKGSNNRLLIPETIFAVSRIRREEIQPKLDGEYRQKVKALRLERPKVTKVEVATMLDLNPRHINRYWGPRDVSEYER